MSGSDLQPVTHTLIDSASTATMQQSTITMQELAKLVDDEPARAATELLEILYGELRVLAISMTARENPGHTIQASDLVHEAYLRLVDDEDRQWNGRRHFFGAAAEAMRRILVEQARRKATLRRGGGRRREPLDESAIGAPANDEELLEVHEVLDRLAAEDPVKAAVVKLRYFIGMTIPETAEVLGISTATVERYWTYSRAQLFHWITGRRPD
jgi:RNA polymerase sigma factor (TIGR02999 family)